MANENRSGFQRDRTERLKIWIGFVALLITQAASLWTAIAARSEAGNEAKAKAAYTELSAALVRVSKDNVQLHSDVASLRGYLAGLAQRGAFDVDRPTSIPAKNGRSVRDTSKRVRSVKPREVKKAAAPKPMAQAPAPPAMSPKPQQYRPLSVNSL